VYIVTPESEAAALHAFDENTGTDTWAPVMVPQDAMGIAFNDGIVVVSTASGTLLAFDAGTGKQLWSKGIGDTNPAVQAPTMANGLVYVGDMAKGGYLYALKEKTGDQLWKAAPVLVFYDLGFGPISVTDTLVVVQSDGGEIRALDPTMGTPLWNTLSNAFAGGPTAIYAQAAFGQVTNKTVNSYKVGDGTPIQKGFPTDLPAAFDGPNGYFVDTQTGTLTAQTLSSGSVAWTFPGDGVLYESPLIVNGLVYATGGPRMASATQQLNGVLFAVSEATGTLIWSATDLPWTPPRTNPWNTSLSGGDSNGIGNIYVGMGSDGTILVVPTPYGLIAYGPPSAVPPPDAGPADAGESDGG
jgi:outer membrane protein assembly factor BamB